MTLPSIHQVRESLADVNGALVDQPSTSKVDIGDVPSVPISVPEYYDTGIGSSPDLHELLEEPAEDEIPIIFEIRPDLDDRTVREQLGQNRGLRFERLIEVNGTDALGWYFPFHYQIAQHGIYISSRGALEFAIYAFRRKYSDVFVIDLSKRLQYAVHAILRHEAFHFATECMAANWELTTGSACYIKASQGLRGPSGYIEQEEALANAYMIRGFRWKNAVTFGAQATSSMKPFCARQPSGYNQGTQYVATSRYQAGCRELAFQYHELMALNWCAPRRSFDSFALFPNAFRIDWRRCPVILADHGNLFSTLGITPKFINCVATINETDAFKKGLERLEPSIQNKWQRTKTKLTQSTRVAGLDFKPWPPRGKGWFSVRVDDDVRVHLRHEGSGGQWYAEEIGRHDVMGH